jgi:hypothetical protein
MYDPIEITSYFTNCHNCGLSGKFSLRTMRIELI